MMVYGGERASEKIYEISYCAIKKSKVCFIEENLARLHDDQQYNREMVQVLKESSPVKKKCFENPVMVQSLTEHVPINTSQGNCEY